MKTMESHLENTLGERLEQKIDQRFDEIERRALVLIEESEHRFLKTSHDQISLQQDTLTNQEDRIQHLERVCA